MIRISLKPPSVNKCWQGKRFKTPYYTAFRDLCTTLLNVIRPPKPPPQTPLFAHYRWGMPNYAQSDTDNPCKPFQDVLFEYLQSTTGQKFDDRHVRFMILEKVKTGKNDGFIEFVVRDEKELIAYLEQLVKQMKGAGNA